MSGSPFTWGTRILAFGALLFVLFLGVGALLPGTWRARASRVVPAEPGAILPYLDGPGGWRSWTPWPEEWLETDGPARGPGAAMRWDHPDMGDGIFEIVAVEGQERVAYTVLVEGGALRTEGRVELAPAEGGTRVTWTEEGDFGWNPLMGYWALAMGTVQGKELRKGLERLEARLTDVPGPPDADPPHPAVRPPTSDGGASESEDAPAG